MTHRASRFVSAVIIALLLTIAAPSAGDFGFQGWGPRVEVSSDPDQIVGGVHFDLGEFASRVRFQPSVEIGFGDHTTTFEGNLMVAYYFPVKAEVTPYAGGQLSMAYYSFHQCQGFGSPFLHRGFCDDNDTEIGPMAVGGIEMKLSNKSRFLAEIQLGFGDLPDAKLVAGWTF
jgi:hypothetical protein